MLPPRGRSTRWIIPHRRLAAQAWERFLAEGALQFAAVRQRMEQMQHEAKAGAAIVGVQFERGGIAGIGAHLAVADDAVTAE